ncbi:MAG: M1 family metallopeptidase [Acidobacteria bacterium]|nr:M1 family metallopeptidase [Acidobacteriota bacterium]
MSISLLFSHFLFPILFLTQGIQEENIPGSGRGEALSARAANYQIQARLDPQARTIRGIGVITWKNLSNQSVDRFYFHLYLNAFKNNRSTFIRENHFDPLWSRVREPDSSYWGYVQVDGVEMLGHSMLPAPGAVKTEYVQPDDGNSLDQTVMVVRAPIQVPPGEVARFRIEFTSKLPRGVSRTGWAEDYFFAAQWFPKIAVLKSDGWNAHQYHRSTEYFADFGTYDVELTVPASFVVGATGRRVSEQSNPDQTKTVRYLQDDVHDFAWVAGSRLREKKRHIERTHFAPLEVTLLLQPEHEHLEERHFTAIRHAVRYFGDWFGEYPYPTLTVVDPAYGSATDGMEYPTFITGGTHFWAPRSVLSPEGVTVHEYGHQYWYGMVANNEFEESWLDEGINSWAEARAQKHAYAPSAFLRRFFGGIPFVANSVRIPFETSSLPNLRADGTADEMVRPGWLYKDRASYRVNSYYKPELILWTLERLVGGKRMLRVMQTFQTRYRFQHPTTADFVATVEEVLGQEMDWFFDQTLFSSEVMDFSIETASSKPLPPRIGFFDRNGTPSYQKEKPAQKAIYWTEVVVRRLGGIQFPVEVLMVFENGEKVRHRWDGNYRWKKYHFEKPSRLKYAVVDPERKLLLDINPVNNSKFVAGNSNPVPAVWKWASKWLFWVQNLLETLAFVA